MYPQRQRDRRGQQQGDTDGEERNLHDPDCLLGVATRWELVPQSRLLDLFVNPNNAERGAMIPDLREAARAKRSDIREAGTERCSGAGGEEMATSSLHLTIEWRDAPAERPGSRPSRAPLKQPKAVLEQAHLAGGPGVRISLWGAG